MKVIQFCFSAGLVLLTACGDHAGDNDAMGIFETTEVIVSAKAGGEIKLLNVEEGQSVNAGDRLGYIDTVQLALKKDQLQATLSATDSRRLDESRQVASLRQQIDNLQRERRRFGDLLQCNAATQKQVDDIDYQIEVLQRQLAATSEQIGSNNSSISGQSASIIAQIAQIDDMLLNSIVSSPIDGTILAKYAEAGEYAVPGRALFKVADVRRVKLRAYVTAGQLNGIKIGQPVKVYADEDHDGRREYDGKVVWITDKAEFTPKTIQTRDERDNLVYAIKVAVENDGYIKIGMYGEVKF